MEGSLSFGHLPTPNYDDDDADVTRDASDDAILFAPQQHRSRQLKNDTAEESSYYATGYGTPHEVRDTMTRVRFRSCRRRLQA